MQTENGTPDAQENCDIADGFFNADDYSNAVTYYKKAAESGEGYALYSLGWCYYYGLGVGKSYAEAVKYYKLAAEKGEDCAEYELGRCYDLGDGVYRNWLQAFKWYKSAADKGNAEALAALGDCYYYGQGVEKDYNKAAEYYKIAADRGVVSAMCGLGRCYKHGHGVEYDVNQSLSWYEMAADNGDIGSIYLLADYHMRVTRNYYMVLSLYKQGSALGYAYSTYRVGWCYDVGVGTRVNVKEAKKWYQKAAEQGEKLAVSALENLED